MTTVPKVELTVTFRDPEATPEKQEKLTQTLWQQMRSLEGVSVDRVSDPNPPEGTRAMGSFLWGLLQGQVSLSSLKTLFGFLSDRIGNKPIKIKAKFADGREFELEANSREELAAAEETIKRLSQSM